MLNATFTFLCECFIDICSVQLLVSIIISNLNFHNNQAPNFFFHLVNFLLAVRTRYITDGQTDVWTERHGS